MLRIDSMMRRLPMGVWFPGFFSPRRIKQKKGAQILVTA
jgi:hypothetical protein